MESQLRTECQSLLQQLQQSQKQLNNEIAAHLRLDENAAKSGTTSDNSGSVLSEMTYARKKLLGATQHNTERFSKVKVTNASRSDMVKDKENYDKNIQNLLTDKTDDQPELSSKHSSATKPLSTQSESCKRIQSSVDDDNDTVISSSCQPATPNTQRRRQLIDRHVIVPTQLSADELRDLNNERQLNFSYSNVDSENMSHLESEKNKSCGSHDNVEAHNKIKEQSSQRQKNRAHTSNADARTDFHKTHAKTDHVLKSHQTVNENVQSFREQLEDDGNNRKLNTFIRDTTIKPKSLLNSTSYSLHNSISSRRNNTSRKVQEAAPDQRLLGYDWIAALLDNDSELIDQSESFFNELRDFRKAYKDECSNQFYMEGPHTLVDLPETDEVHKETKVEPFVINERLFPESLKPDLFDDDVRGRSRTKKSKTPSEYSPRFVRVSIPRSRIQSPHRVRPHRRRSFDASDSCSLADHCLLGWKSVRPSFIPTAKTVDLNTAAGIHSGCQKMTLAEAERLASVQSSQSKPTARLRMIPMWRKHYMDLSLPTSNGSSYGSETVRRATDKLLNSAYETMYEMERLKEERKLEKMMSQQKKM